MSAIAGKTSSGTPLDTAPQSGGDDVSSTNPLPVQIITTTVDPITGEPIPVDNAAQPVSLSDMTVFVEIEKHMRNIVFHLEVINGSDSPYGD